MNHDDKNGYQLTAKGLLAIVGAVLSGTDDLTAGARWAEARVTFDDATGTASLRLDGRTVVGTGATRYEQLEAIARQVVTETDEATS